MVLLWLVHVYLACLCVRKHACTVLDTQSEGAQLDPVPQDCQEVFRMLQDSTTLMAIWTQCAPKAHT